MLATCCMKSNSGVKVVLVGSYAVSFLPPIPLVFCFRISHRIKKMRERINNFVLKPKNKMLVMGFCLDSVGPTKFPPVYQPDVKKIRERVLEIIARIDKLNDNVTYSFFRASEVIGLDEDRAKPIVYIVVCIVGVCKSFLPLHSLSKSYKDVPWNEQRVGESRGSFENCRIFFYCTNIITPIKQVYVIHEINFVDVREISRSCSNSSDFIFREVHFENFGRIHVLEFDPFLTLWSKTCTNLPSV